MPSATTTCHDLSCASRIRESMRSAAGVLAHDAGPDGLRERIALAISKCCGHPRLKCFRLAAGWTVASAIDNFHRMCDRDGFKRRGLTERSWRQWEAGDRPSRDYEDLLCRLFDTGPVQLGFAADYTRRVVVRERDLELPRPRIPMALPLLKGTGGHASSVLTFGHSFQTEAEVIMSAARESAHFTQYAGRTNVGPHTLDQLDADLRNLIKAYPGRPVFPTFLELVDLRNRAFELLEGQQYPKQGRDLYLIAGVTCGVLANASFDLGHMDAAATQARTAYLCAELAGSDWLRTWVRGMQSLIAYWGDHFEEAISLASSVRETVSGQGSAAVRLASIEARAHARVGNAEGVETALAAAANARETADHPDEYGGMMAFPVEKQLFYGSTCQVWLGGRPRLHRAAREASQAVSMFEQAPPGQRRVGEMCLARLDLAASRLETGELDGTAEQVHAVFTDAANRRTDSVKRRLHQVRIQLEAPEVRTSPLAATLRDEIIEFCAPPAPALPEGHTP
ncbi:hypothetical protein DFP74_1626 [Nocardiopsis sp. Huas11]|nr:hypothetical protein DFP74_1626 [Nocardiopsis sp. Huas11]